MTWVTIEIPDDGRTLEISFVRGENGEVSCGSCSSVFTDPPLPFLAQHAREHVRDASDELACERCGHVNGMAYDHNGQERTVAGGDGWSIEVPAVLVCRNPDCSTNETDMAKVT